MRRKSFWLVLIILFVTGELLITNKQSFAPTVKNPVGPSQPNPTSNNQTNQGVVVANDETKDSPPRQVTVTEPEIPTPAYAQRKPSPEVVQYVTINNKQYPLRVYKTLALPNDPNANQWWVTTTKMEQAWDVPAGSKQTTLAIIDTGFGLGHEEFVNRWYQNPGESGSATAEAASSLNCTARSLAISASCNLIDDNRDGIIDNETGVAAYQNPSRLNCTDQSKPLNKDCNRIDDDGNDHIDDVTGWDFMNNDNSVLAGELNPSGSGTTHGTMVAGVAAATGNNSKGIAGVDWNTKVLPIQALDDNSYGDTLSVGQAIFYAVEQGADVISLSLGSVYPDDYVREAVQAAIEQGIVVVAASGNDGCNCIVYPANYPEVVGVGALDSTAQPASFSSWGTSLDILAPGTQIRTPTWSAGNQTSAYAASVAGTSFATPMVSGVLTRLLSLQPDAKPLQLIAALTENTNRSSFSTNLAYETKKGFGFLDANKAAQRMTTPASYTQLNSFVPLQQGGFISPSDPVESVGTFLAHHCASNIVGTTAIYDLSKTGSRFFTISRVEEFKARQTGYTSSFLTYACLEQPHDSADIIRDISLFGEFRNILRPL